MDMCRDILETVSVLQWLLIGLGTIFAVVIIAYEIRINNIEHRDSPTHWALIDAQAELIRARENVEEARDTIKTMHAELEVYRGIREHSEGVTGYHLNGDIAPWSDFWWPGENQNGDAKDNGMH